MPTITINGTECEFTPGEKIIAVANRCGIDIPQYCYHPGLSIPAQCRICLAEVWAPNPRNDDALEPMMGGKLLPTCSTDAGDGMVVYSDSPKAVANQKAVMEFLLINHPLDCPVCDQAGECDLQDFSYQYGRGTSRFEDQKVKQAKKNLGPHVYLYADRCIMCTRCVRFAREVPETGEIMIDGRGNRSEIDVFPGVPLANELSANVIDLCPVGALLDKDFLFAQRVWFLKSTPSIDGITASGDNLLVEHNEGRVYRLKPRENTSVNKWWITDEVRYGWKFVHSEDRLTTPTRRQHGTLVDADYQSAYAHTLDGLRGQGSAPKRLGVVVSPMLSCEDAYALATLARSIDPQAVLSVGPVPFRGEDKTFPSNDENGFRICAEKAPNARGVRRVLSALTGGFVPEHDEMLARLKAGKLGALIITGNYPSEWAVTEMLDEIARARSADGGLFTVLIDTLRSPLQEHADVVLPGATWLEKAGTFENAREMLQSFEQAIPVTQNAKSEGQIATDLAALLAGSQLHRPEYTQADVIVDDGPGQVPAASAVVAIPLARRFNAADTRREMAEAHDPLGVFLTEVSHPATDPRQQPDMEVVEL